MDKIKDILETLHDRIQEAISREIDTEEYKRETDMAIDQALTGIEVMRVRELPEKYDQKAVILVSYDHGFRDGFNNAITKTRRKIRRFRRWIQKQH